MSENLKIVLGKIIQLFEFLRRGFEEESYLHNVKEIQLEGYFGPNVCVDRNINFMESKREILIFLEILVTKILWNLAKKNENFR